MDHVCGANATKQVPCACRRHCTQPPLLHAGVGIPTERAYVYVHAPDKPPAPAAPPSPPAAGGGNGSSSAAAAGGEDGPAAAVTSEAGVQATAGTGWAEGTYEWRINTAAHNATVAVVRRAERPAAPCVAAWGVAPTPRGDLAPGARVARGGVGALTGQRHPDGRRGRDGAAHQPGRRVRAGRRVAQPQAQPRRLAHRHAGARASRCIGSPRRVVSPQLRVRFAAIPASARAPRGPHHLRRSTCTRPCPCWWTPGAPGPRLCSCPHRAPHTALELLLDAAQRCRLFACRRGGPGSSTHVDILGNEELLADVLRVATGAHHLVSRPCKPRASARQSAGREDAQPRLQRHVHARAPGPWPHAVCALAMCCPGRPLCVVDGQVEDRLVSRVAEVAARIDWEDPDGWENAAPAQAA